MNLTDLIGKVDFTLAFAMVHELPSASQFFMEAFQLSKQGASLLLAEPAGHVKDEAFEAELQNATQVGFAVAERPNIRRSPADQKSVVDTLRGLSMKKVCSWMDLFQWTIRSSRKNTPTPSSTTSAILTPGSRFTSGIRSEAAT